MLAGATADAFTLFERLEMQLEQHSGEELLLSDSTLCYCLDRSLCQQEGRGGGSRAVHVLLINQCLFHDQQAQCCLMSGQHNAQCRQIDKTY